MTTSIGSLYVGASGFSYPSWKGGFYPPGTPPRNYLRFYAERLPSVELNSTFYNLPSESTVASWVDATPAAFRFAVKMSRRATQFGNVDAAAELCERMRGLGERLGPIRIVLTRARDDGWLDLLAGSLDPALAYVWDLRHASWEEASLPFGVRVDALEADEPFRYLRFRHPPYDDEALERIALTVRSQLGQGCDVYAYFRHEDAPTAPDYASRLEKLLRT